MLFFPKHPVVKPKPIVKKPERSVLEYKLVKCPRCGVQGVVKPLRRKKGYRIKVVLFCYHLSSKGEVSSHTIFRFK